MIVSFELDTFMQVSVNWHKCQGHTDVRKLKLWMVFSRLRLVFSSLKFSSSSQLLFGWDFGTPQGSISINFFTSMPVLVTLINFQGHKNEVMYFLILNVSQSCVCCSLFTEVSIFVGSVLVLFLSCVVTYSRHSILYFHFSFHTRYVPCWK